MLLGVGLILWLATGPQWSRAHISLPGGRPIVGYVANTPQMTQEYERFYGIALNHPDVARWFEEASGHARARDYLHAAQLLEQVSKVAALPVVFNNLGVLYVELSDKARAIHAFREALARDPDYTPVRSNLERMTGAIAVDAAPVTQEVEPNNEAALANTIALGKTVAGEIAAAVDDEDFFRLTTPPAPRDLLSIEITNASKTLSPVLRIFDAEKQITDWSKVSTEAGSSLQLTISPPPNTTLYLQVSGLSHSDGAYRLLVRPQKAFDRYEPNDDIRNATQIVPGKTVEAGIMDAADTDYYSFVSPRTGTVGIAVLNRSTTLIPGVGTFQPDLRPAGPGVDGRTRGANLKHTLEVREKQTYYIQVRSLANTAGDYSLIIE